jgi:hypothetical protein
MYFKHMGKRLYHFVRDTVDTHDTLKYREVNLSNEAIN